MERQGDIVVHLKFTVLLLPSGTQRITGLSYPTGSIVSEKEVPEEIASILATSSKKKKKKNKNKNKGEGEEAA